MKDLPPIGNSPIHRPGGFRAIFAWTLAVGILSGPHAHAQGIPEPTFIFYGTIRNAADNNLRLTHGTLEVVNRKASNGRVVSLTSLVSNYAGFSYVLEVPAETLVAGPVSSNVLELTATSAQFDWLSVVHNSGTVRTPLTFAVPSQNSFQASSRQRGRIERVDFTMSVPCIDADGNGLCDEWELRYWGAIGISGRDDDFDGDGLTNGQEYRVGSDPTDPDSGLLFADWQPLKTTAGAPLGVKVTWASVDGRAYGLYRSTNLFSILNSSLTQAPDVRLVATNLVATPPQNEFLDTNAPTTGPSFYRLRLE